MSAATTRPAQSSTDPADTAHLRDGARITLEEAGLHVDSVAVVLRQVARALETPSVPVELEDLIKELRSAAAGLGKQVDVLRRLERIVTDEVPVATTFPNSSDRWGAAARGADRAEYGGPAVIPTVQQLLLLARHAERTQGWGEPVATTTFGEAMAGVRMVESRTAMERRRVERAALIDAEIPKVVCGTKSCGAGEGESCRTIAGRLADQPHRGRLTEATARVDARIGWHGTNPAGVDVDA